jgi:phytoene dehydrogenase-like protein
MTNEHDGFTVSSETRNVSEPTFDVIVIGAGFGGATSAALLAKRGLRVLLLEKNAQAGGKAMVISKKGFTYEMWPVIHAPNQQSRCIQVLRELGLEGAVELVVPTRVRGAIYIDTGGRVRRFPDNPEQDPRKVFDVLGVAPADRDKAVQVLTEITLMSLADVGALDEVTFTEWIERRGTPRPIAAYLNALANGVFMVPSDQLAASEAILTLQEILTGGGGLYCRNGGIGRLAEVFASAVETHGGRTLYHTKVSKIRVEDGRVTGVITDNATYATPIVISNVGLQPTVLKLIGPQHFDKSYVNYVTDLRPSWGMMGVRYFLERPLLDEPFNLIFSDDAYWTTDRWLHAASGTMPENIILWTQVPAVNNPELAPPGKQCVLTGIWCSPDPNTPIEEKQRWWAKIDAMMTRIWPGFMFHIEGREPYDTHDVSALSRDQALPGVGGECIGLGQVVGQCGRHKPSAQAPVRGLFYAGCDAGGYGCGTNQAVDSGINVADLVLRYYRLRQTSPPQRSAPVVGTRGQLTLKRGTGHTRRAAV